MSTIAPADVAPGPLVVAPLKPPKTYNGRRLRNLPISIPDTEEVQACVKDLGDELRDRDLGPQATLLQLLYEAGPRAASRLVEETRAEAEAAKRAANGTAQQMNATVQTEIDGLGEEESRIDGECEQAEETLGTHASKVGMPIDPSSIDADAFRRGPSRRELAGEHGLPYMPAAEDTESPSRDESETRWTRLKRAVARFPFIEFAPPVIGLVVGISIGVVTGLIDLEALQDIGQCWRQLLVPCSVGVVAVYLLGGVASRFVRAINEANSSRNPDDGPNGPVLQPRYAWVLWIKTLVWGALATLGALAEITVGARGIGDLYLQHLAYLARVSDNIVVAPLPSALALLIACLISLPYVALKAIAADQKWRDQQTDNHLSSVRRKWWEEWIKQPTVASALEALHDVLRLRARSKRIQKEIAALEAKKIPVVTGYPEGYDERLEIAEAIRRREDERFRKHVTAVVESICPLPRRRTWWDYLWMRG